LGSWQDDHDEKDVKESQRDSGQDASAFRCLLYQELLDDIRNGKAAEKLNSAHI
jgi:hypothetical protein